MTCSRWREKLMFPVAAAGLVLVIYGALTGRIDVPLGGGIVWRRRPRQDVTSF